MLHICLQDVSVSLKVSVNICEMRLWQNGSVKFVLRELRSRLFPMFGGWKREKAKNQRFNRIHTNIYLWYEQAFGRVYCLFPPSSFYPALAFSLNIKHGPNCIR